MTDGPILDVLSLGAGRQSTCMALMAAHGEIQPMPAAAIFADTGAEPAAVYRHLDWLMSGNVLPFPVRVVRWSDLEADTRRFASGGAPGSKPDANYLTVPFHVTNADGSAGMLSRGCTDKYKIRPIRRELKRMLGVPEDESLRSPVPLVRQWIGISADEWVRAKASKVKWCASWHPLIDRLTGDGPPGQNTRHMTAGDCLEWLKRHDYPEPPSSACVFCPYQSNERWRAVRAVPEDWERACATDRVIRDMPADKRGALRAGGRLYAHRSGAPLEEARLGDDSQGDLFHGECEGMCGV